MGKPDLLQSERERCGSARMSEPEALDYAVRWIMERGGATMPEADAALAAARNIGRDQDTRFVDKLRLLLRVRCGR